MAKNWLSTYTYRELQLKTMADLNSIKQSKQDQLYDIQKEKDVLCGNIMSLQDLIKTQKARS